MLRTRTLCKGGMMTRWLGVWDAVWGTSNLCTVCFVVVVAFWDIYTMNYNDIYFPLITMHL